MLHLLLYLLLRLHCWLAEPDCLALFPVWVEKVCVRLPTAVMCEGKDQQCLLRPLCSLRTRCFFGCGRWLSKMLLCSVCMGMPSCPLHMAVCTQRM